MKILIRFDDICPTMDWEMWNKAECIMDQMGIKPLIGIVPECKDPELLVDEPSLDFWKWAVRKQKEGYTIAMHGVYHKYLVHNKRGLVNNKYDSEFAGLPYEVQYEMIKKGKEILKSHGIITDIFFAPSHSYDNNTIKALAECGFKYISDGKSSKPINRNGIICIPCKWNSRNRWIAGEYQTIVYHTNTWRNTNLSSSFKDFEKTCNRCDIVSWDEFINRPIGNFIYQSISEFLYLVLERNVIPIIRRMKNHN